jgi:uncharacterized membrane protein YqjE
MTDGTIETNGAQDELRSQSVGELMKRLATETATLVRQEIDLAKAEVSEKGKKAGQGAGLFGGAGVAGLLALATLTACLVLVLDTAMRTWLAALIVGALWSAIAGVLALSGRQRMAEGAPPVPEQTVETLKEDVEWAKTRSR